ncbi:MAG: hypothetical protein U0796_04645 [Gemmatales bacterium]
MPTLLPAGRGAGGEGDPPAAKCILLALVPATRLRYARSMKRRFSFWRITLALLLLGSAWLTHRAWPQKQWHIEAPLSSGKWTIRSLLDETLLGFDIPAKLVYTVAREGQRYDLKGYDLYRGTCVKRLPLHPVTAEFKEPDKLRVGETAEAWKVRVSEQWKWGLSSNKRELLAFNEDQAHFQLLDIETGQCLKRFEYANNFSSFPMQLCFSPDGRYVGIVDRGGLDK